MIIRVMAAGAVILAILVIFVFFASSGVSALPLVAVPVTGS